MKTSTASLVPLAALLLLLPPLLSPAEAAIGCATVLRDLTPCVGYLTIGGRPSRSCCSGVTKLAAAASTTADRRAACNCMQSLAQGTRPNTAAAKALPGRCGLSLPYDISPNTDCSKIT